jgi:HK97 family phage major capsid protein
MNNSTYGLLAKGTAYVDNLADSDISRIDVLIDAARQVADDEYRATAMLVHPTDATAMKLTKDDNGNYIFPWVFMPNGNVVLDGIPVIVTTAVAANTFLVGDFKRAAQIFDRRQLSVEFSNTNEDNFIKGMVTVRCSERIAIVVYRPKAFVYGTFVNAMALGSA